jgi:hypothetical protein
MRFLKTLTLNRRAIYDDRVALTTEDTFTVATSNNMVLPKSNNSLSAVQVEGMLRYNTTSKDVEVYSGNPASWRTLRYKESTGITQQNLGYGDSDNVFFGPLNPTPPSIVESGTTWGGQNLIVVVENVIQLHGINYTIVQNPTIPGQEYTGDTSANATTGDSVINFDVSTLPIYPSVNITGAEISGSASIPSSTTITEYTTNSSGQLTSVTISNVLTNSITAGTELTITDLLNADSGYFIQFNSAVPYGKPVTVLHGFDQ